MKYTVFLCGLLVIIFQDCNIKNDSQNIEILPVSNIYFNKNDGKYSNENGIFFRNGQPFSGILLSLYSSLDTESVIPFYKGLEEGWTRKYYPHQQLSEERLYHLGKKESIHQGWWENGQIKFLYCFKNDNHDGKAQTWYESGNPATENFYEKGYETGLQRAWYADGVLRANYDSRNGRQYGLTGVKNCQSVWDSVTKKYVELNLTKGNKK